MDGADSPRAHMDLASVPELFLTRRSFGATCDTFGHSRKSFLEEGDGSPLRERGIARFDRSSKHNLKVL